MPVISTDFFPTILEIADVSTVQQQYKDGISIVPLLKGAKSLDRESLFWHYPHYGNQGGSPGAAIRAGDYKLIEFFEDNHVELYNLKDDIGEQNNLAVDMPEKVKELRNILHQWQNEVDAQLPAANPLFKN